MSACLVKRCKRRPTPSGRCKTHLKQKADQLFSVFIRRRDMWCAALGRDCKRPLQCAHIVSRRYLATRWDEQNAIALCLGHHKFFTEHPLEWEVWLEAHLPGRLVKMKRRALGIANVDDPINADEAVRRYA